MWTSVRSSRFYLIHQLIILSLLFSGIYLLLEVGVEVGVGVRVRHEISVFVSFLLLPSLYLSFTPSRDLSFIPSLYPPFTPSRDPSMKCPLDQGKRTTFDPLSVLRSLGGINRGFLQGLLIYLIFTFYIFVYLLQDPGFLSPFDKHGFSALSWITLTALNVMPVDFFTKRFIQLPLSRKFGPGIAITLQTLVWLAAHIPESFWLDDLMGTVGVWVFLGFTGLATGILYERTRNVSGMMAGHVMLNVLVVAMAKFM